MVEKETKRINQMSVKNKERRKSLFGFIGIPPVNSCFVSPSLFNIKQDSETRVTSDRNVKLLRKLDNFGYPEQFSSICGKNNYEMFANSSLKKSISLVSILLVLKKIQMGFDKVVKLELLPVKKRKLKLFFSLFKNKWTIVIKELLLWTNENSFKFSLSVT